MIPGPLLKSIATVCFPLVKTGQYLVSLLLDGWHEFWNTTGHRTSPGGFGSKLPNETTQRGEDAWILTRSSAW